MNELNPQQVGDEQQSSLNVFRGDNGINLEDINGITFTVDPQNWDEKATEDDIVTKKIDLE